MTQYEIFYFLFRNKWLILFGVVVGLISAAAAYKLSPKHYRSDAKLLVRYVSDTIVIDPEMSGERRMTPGRPNETLITTEVDILTSAELFSSAAKALTAESSKNTNQPTATASAGEIAKNFKVETTKNSNTIRVSFDGTTPEDAQRTLSRLIEAYLVKHQSVHQDPGAFEFISRQADEMRTRVNDTEDELRRVKNQAGIVSLAESRQMVLGRIQDLDKAMRDNESTLAATRARMQSLAGQVSRRSDQGATNGTLALPTGAVSTDVVNAMARLGALSRRESQLLTIYTSNSVPVRSLRQQIDELEDFIVQSSPGRVAPAGLSDSVDLGRPPTDILATDFASYRAEEAALLAQAVVLRKQQGVAQGDLERMESSDVQLSRLERTREIYDTNFRYFSKRLEQARIDSALEASKVSNIALIQPPTMPGGPLTEELLKMLGIIMAGCLGVGVGLGVLREYVFDLSIRHPQEIPRLLRIPLLATLPIFARKGSAQGVQMGSVEAACEVVAQLIRERAEHSEQSLLVGFTAPHAGSGVTTLAERVASAMQLSGFRRVLLATITDSGQFVGKLLGEISAEADIGDFAPFEGNVQGHQTSAQAQLPVKVAFSSPVPITPGIFSELKRQDYDCVLFDLPPLAQSEITVRLLSRLHGVVVVLETLRTPRGQAVGCVHQLEQIGCVIYGAVLNKFRTPVPTWITPPPAAKVPRSVKSPA